MRALRGTLVAGIAASTLLWAASGHAQGSMPPNNTDLKAAYCAAVEKDHTEELQGLLGNLDTDPPQPNVDPKIVKAARDSRNEAAERLNHLQLYLLPRLKFLDAEGLLGASAQGKRDRAKLKEPAVTLCFAQCQQQLQQKLAQHKADKGEFEACTKSCSPEALTRIWACRDLSWLPF